MTIDGIPNNYWIALGVKEETNVNNSPTGYTDAIAWASDAE